MGKTMELLTDKTRKAKIVVECSGHRVVQAYPSSSVYATYYFEEARPNALDDSLSFVTVGVLSLEPGKEVPDGATLVMPSGIVLEMLRLVNDGNDGKHKPELIQ